ncbi:uncharacterized protein LOC123536598 [Mercenaria mercenaria]|uniref:uncharacterized protein LOC123536598 n=1 Tax=Mercenaria mercenaria TaxID=6596 RepID=UPI00234F6C33|nr:uncharacterized protein LOC123536598 [Mercenaria mercenaria]
MPSSRQGNHSEHSDKDVLRRIRVIIDDGDPDIAVLSLENLVGMFIENVTIFDNGQIYVYLNLLDSFLNEIEDTSKEDQKDFALLSDVYNSYNTFLLYRDANNCVKILPRNQTFHPVFQRLKTEEKNFNSNVFILLEKHINHQDKAHIYVEKDRKRDAKFGFAAQSDKSHTKGVSGEGKVEKVAIDRCKQVSLTYAKSQMYVAISKVIICRRLSFYSLRQLQPPTPRTRDLFEGKFPVQVSDEQRDDENFYCERVVSTSHSNRCRDDISYGIGPRSRTESGFGSPVVGHVRSYLQESNCLEQQCPDNPPRYPDYYDCAERLASFTKWFHKSPEPATLSQAGFFFTSQGDLVRCFQCGIGLKDFSDGDDPLFEHVRHSRQCPFLPKFLGADMLAAYQNHLQDVDPVYNRRLQWAEIQEGTVPTYDCRHPEYKALQERLSSFKRWPVEKKQAPEQMAAAGLYHTGYEDHVRCFACDGGLRCWDPDDDPWVEHCRWFPACPYALQKKGGQYIALVQASVENENYGANGGGEQDWTSEFKQSKLRSSVMRAMSDCLELGYKEEYVYEAVQTLKDRGNGCPSLRDVIIMTDGCRERELTGERFEFCIKCGENPINTLSIPCAHHKLCICCAESTDLCLVCSRPVTKTIRTYMP